MPRFPSSGGNNFAQLALQTQAMGEDRKARKAAQRQALLGMGVGLGTNLLGQGLGTFRTVYENAQAAERQKQGQEFSSKMLEKKAALENPMIDDVMPEGAAGPAPRISLQEFQARTGRLAAEKNSPFDKLEAAFLFNQRQGLTDLPGAGRLTPAELDAVRRGERPDLQSALGFEAQARKKLSDYGNLDAASNLTASSAQRREAIALAIGALAQRGASQDEINAFVNSLPSGPPAQEPPPFKGFGAFSEGGGMLIDLIRSAVGDKTVIMPDEKERLIQGLINRANTQNASPLTPRELLLLKQRLTPKQ